MKRQRWKPGAFIEIPIDSDMHTYGRLLKHPFIAVYDHTSEQSDCVEEIANQPVLFVIPVMDRAIKNGRWKIIGVAPCHSEIPIPEQFMQDILNPNNCQIIDYLGNIRDATIEECEGMERAAVWDAKHVEERIRDHYAGRKNAYLESMKLKRER